MSEINTVAIIGAGTMGVGIASVNVTSDKKVYLIDISKESLLRAKNNITKSLEKSYAKGFISKPPEEYLKNIQFADDFSVLKKANLVIEAAFESMEVKSKVFKELNSYTNDNAIIASNTSALSISLAEATPS